MTEICSMDDAKKLRTIGLRFTTPKGCTGIILKELSPRGKLQAELSCAVPGCSEVHTREISDWHHSGHCRKHSHQKQASPSRHIRTASSSTSASESSVIAATVPLSQERLFDAFVMVDWSANGEPKPGPDSIWWTVAQRRGSELVVGPPANPLTRQTAFVELYLKLQELAEAGFSVLVGLDFAFGYPRGLASRLGIGSPAWRGLWDEWSARIEDIGGNANNRFEVAGRLNHQISGGCSPFWGLPVDWSVPGLGPVKPPKIENLADKRITEQRAPKSQSVWQIFYTGSVGGQALCGIPYASALRNAPGLRAISSVWPFETGFTSSPAKSGSAHILLAEIFPSLITDGRNDEARVRDEVQVTTLAEHFAQFDAAGRLGRLFDRPANLTDNEVDAVLDEEGWILGT